MDLSCTIGKALRILIITLAFILLISIHADTLDYPHYEINNISCDSCHFVYGGEPSLLPPWTAHIPQDIDDTQYNTLCWSCHNNIDAPYVRTHSSLQIDNSYGDWTVECRICHDPHVQKQFRIYRSESYLYSGISTDIQVDQPEKGMSQLIMTGAGWTDNEYQGLVVIPNVNEEKYSYKILSNTNDTLTIEGVIDLFRVTPGVDTFAIIYGKLIKNTIVLDDITTYTGVLTDIPDEYTLVEAGAGWTTNQYQGLTVIPNTSYPLLKYTIISNTTDTLTIQEPMDLSKVEVGKVFKIVALKTGSKAVKFFKTTDVNSFADGDETYNGICEVCHTQTTYHKNNGTGLSHNAGTNCIQCHTHLNGFGHGGAGGIGCEGCHGKDADNGGKGTTVSHSTHTENDADDLRGPFIGCNSCHDTNNFPYFKSGIDSDGDGKYNLSETDVCDNCHSPGGTYDGVNDPVIGAKNNWRDGVYEGAGLKLGKEKWCAGCHDEVPSIIQGVSAPNVIGDEDALTDYGIGYGFYKTGHGLSSRANYPATGARGAGVECLDCHDSEMQHIDGIARTYEPDTDYLSYDPVSANYQNGYRLMDVNTGYDNKYPMHIPRTGNLFPHGFRANWEFALCFICHNPDDLLVGDITNFREGANNLHDLHTDGRNGPWGAETPQYDSDFDGTADSRISCPACHNVHGSKSPAMLRSGELINKEPALNFKYIDNSPGVSWWSWSFTSSLAQSTGGALDLTPGPATVSSNGVCNMCHNQRAAYYREGSATISSASDQIFVVGDTATLISPITVTDASVALITTSNDIRITIPSGFNMLWDTTITTASISGSALSKVSTSVTYEDGGRTVVIDVITDFAGGESITVSGLKFTAFTSSSPPDNLELEIDNAGTVIDEDDKTITIIEAGTDYYVDAVNGNNLTGDGSQSNPWKTITHALTMVPDGVSTIHVASGTYNQNLGESFPINLKDGVSLQGEDAASTIIDATGSNQSVIYGWGISSLTTIKGFTITGGYSQGDGAGGGIYLVNSSPVISDNIIVDNIASNNTAVQGAGGGIFLFSSSPTIDHNIIAGNIGENTAGSSGAAGGIACASQSSPVIKNNIIARNSAYSDFYASGEGTGASAGGGISVTRMSNPTIENNTIIDNSAHSLGDYGAASGGISIVYRSFPTVRNNVIENNTGEVNGIGAMAGGGIVINYESDPDILVNTITGNYGANNTAIEDNPDQSVKMSQSGSAGGGISVNRRSEPLISRNTITKNIAENLKVHDNDYKIGGAGGGIAIFYRSKPTVSYNIIRENDSRGYYHGGGINVVLLSTPTITDNYIAYNTAEVSVSIGGGGIGFGPFEEPDGITADTTLVRNNIIINNTATLGYSGGGISIRYKAHPTLENNLIVKNTGRWAGGIAGYRQGAFTVINCTVAENEGEGMFTMGTWYFWRQPTVVNSIFWGNTDDNIQYWDDLSVTYSNATRDTGTTVYPGEGNINADPLFADPANNDYHLTAGSPSIDSGTSSNAPADDIDNHSRPQGAGYDMGADEYIDAPAVTMVDPNQGYNNTATDVTIYGVNFTGATSVKIGTEEIADWSVVSDTRITATIPSGLAPGTYDITVTTPQGTSSASSGDQFTVMDGTILPPSEPVVTSVEPDRGYSNIEVTIYGVNFTGATSVKIGTEEIADWSVVSDTRITATIPSGLAPGIYDITVTTPQGTSLLSSSDIYTVLEDAGLDYYVDAIYGDDVTGTGSQSDPWKTITHALNEVATTGVTIHVASGTYNIASGETFPLIIKEGVSLVGDGARTTIIDASGSNQPVIYGSDISDGSNTVLEGFTITGGNSSDPDSGGGIWLNNASPTIRNNIIKNNYGAAAGAISVQNFSSPAIINNTIVNNSADTSGAGGIYCYLQSHPLITNATIANNYTGGVKRDFVSYPTIVNSIIWGNGGDQLWSYDRITYSDIEPEIGGGRTNQGTGNISVDPVFVNPLAGNYHLHFTSPAIDAGTSEGAPDTDIDGDPRPLRGGYDMGADEYAGIKSIQANDASGGGPGIQAGDQVIIIFDQGTNGAPIDASNIDSVLQLSNSHTWKDGTGAIGSATWSTTTYTNDTLIITLSTTGAPPSVAAGAFGDNLTLDEVTILDTHGDPVSGMEKIKGVFGANNYLINGDFETGDLTGWNIIQGTAFDNQPVDASTIADSQGSWAISSDTGGTGKIVSDFFIFSARTIKFWIGGTDTSATVKMFSASDGKQWWSQKVPSGYASGLTEITISKPEYTGLPAYIEITDTSASKYINVDNIHLVTEIYYAEASDASGGGPDIQAGDAVTIKFKGITDAPPVDASGATIGGVDIDTVLQLSNGHTWKDGSGKIGGGTWSTSEYENDTLTIILSTDGGVPTVSPGDTVFLDEVTIKDHMGNPVVNPSSPVTIVGHFGVSAAERELVGEWHFDENTGATAFDSSGKGNDGTISGATWTTGKIGSALEYGGDADHYVEVPDSPSLDITNQITIEAWIYPTGNTEIWPTVIDKYNYGIYLGEPWEGQPKAYIWIMDSSGGWHDVGTYAPVLPLNTWTHVVGTFDGQSLKIYYNGELQETSNFTATIGTNDFPLRIGSSDPAVWGGWEFPFMGKIDEVRIYSYALSSDEVMDRYTGRGPTTSLISAVASDASGGGVGIQAGDQVVITFDGETDGAVIDASNIDTVLALSSGHTWLDGSGGIGGAVWSTNTYSNDTLTITLSDTEGVPTVTVGDTITLNGTIRDSSGTSIYGSIDITGSFGVNVPGGAVAYWTLDEGAGSIAYDWAGDNDGTIEGIVDNIALNKPVSAIYSPGFGSEGYITDGVFAPEGTSWKNSNYAVKLNGSGTAYTLTIDLGSLVSGINHVIVQADDNDTYRVEYSSDGFNWSTLYNVSQSSGGGLRTRDSGIFAPVSARYIRIYATGGDGYYSVSELQIFIQSNPWVDGKAGKALNFDGVNDYVSVTDSAGLKPAALTVEAWIKPLDLPSLGRSFILAKYSDNQGWYIDLYSSGEINLRLYNGSSSTNFLIGTISTGNWYHIAFTYDTNSDQIKTYLNGSLVEDTTYTSYISSDASLIFGKASHYDGEYYSGIIDEVVIYDRALTASEILDRYNLYGP
jgi:galactitol-specific phosphotransferase system IIB component